MIEENDILKHLNNTQALAALGYVFEYEPSSVDGDLSFTALNKVFDRYVFFCFVGMDAYETLKNKFSGYTALIENPAELSIYRSKYIEKNYGKAELEKLSLNAYKGSINDKLRRLCRFSEHHFWE